MSRYRAALVVGAVALLSLSALPACNFVRVVAHNAKYFFDEPAPAPRSDGIGDGTDPLSVLWVGHATLVLQLGDRVVVTDPVFVETVATFSRRLIAAGLPPTALPPRTTALISHRHFDHLSRDSLAELAERLDVVLVPEGAAADVPAGPRVETLSPWRTEDVAGVRVTAVPVDHRGDRFPWDGDAYGAAFTGYVVERGDVSVFFAGDTAFDADAFAAIRARFPRLTLALLPVGPIAPAEMMLPNHMNPAQALAAFQILGAQWMVPMHFSTFLHSLDEPGDVERALQEALDAAPDLKPRVARLLVGERRAFVPEAPPSSAQGLTP